MKNTSNWWEKEDFGEWALSRLKEWEERYASDVVIGEKSKDALMLEIDRRFSLVEKEPFSYLGKDFLESFLMESHQDQTQNYFLYLIGKTDASMPYYQLEGKDIDIWILLGENGFLASNSSLLECDLRKQQGIPQDDLDNNTEKAFWYFANLNSLHLQTDDAE